MTKISLDSFTQAYVEAMLWSSTDDNDVPLDRNYSINDIAPEAMERIKADCEKFQAEAGELIEADTCSRGGHGYSQFEQAGHDFWLTRNGHGAGFWDGDWPMNGDLLTQVSKSFGEVNPYVGDYGKIYLF